MVRDLARQRVVINVGDVVLLPECCSTDRADYPCPFARQRATVTSVEWMRDEGCYLINVKLPGVARCDYWGTITNEGATYAEINSCCLYSTDVTLVAPRGDPRGHRDLLQMITPAPNAPRLESQPAMSGHSQEGDGNAGGDHHLWRTWRDEHGVTWISIPPGDVVPPVGRYLAWTCPRCNTIEPATTDQPAASEAPCPSCGQERRLYRVRVGEKQPGVIA